MSRSAGLISAQVVAVLLLAGCGGESEPTSAEEPTAEASASEEPSTSEPTATGPVDKFDISALCPTDRALSEKVTGTPLTTDTVYKAGEDNEDGFPMQGETCVLVGPRGQVEASVITEPFLVERRKNMDFATIAPCETAPLDGGWDKAYVCDLPDGRGPILERNGTDSVFICGTAAKGPKPAADANGRALCDSVLAAVSG